VICQAWIDGVSTRKVDQLVRAMGNDTGISRSTVSRMCGEIDEAVQEFLHRRIDHTWFPYLFLDATYLDVRHRGRVVSQALVVATGVSGEVGGRSSGWRSATRSPPTSGPSSSAACASAG
jgi:transposase-like protein